MNPLNAMDRRSRSLWQAAAASKRGWYASGGGFGHRRSLSVVADVRFGHGVLLKYAREGVPYDPYWWS